MALATERVFAAAPDVSAGGRVISSPFQFYMEGEDLFYLTWWSSVAAKLRFAGRWIDSSQQLQVFEHTFQTTATRVPASQEIRVGRGYLLNCGISCTTGEVQVGQLFVRVRVIRGHATAFVDLGSVLQGYVSTQKRLSFPGSPVEGSLEGPGWLRVVTVTNPAAGAKLAISPSGGARWRVQSIYTLLATAGGGVDRRAMLYTQDALGNLFGTIGAPAVQAAALVYGYSWTRGATAQFVTGWNQQQGGLPLRFFVDDQTQISIEALNMAAGDQWSACRVTTEEWIDVDSAGLFTL